jgi:hypothetical protein
MQTHLSHRTKAPDKKNLPPVTPGSVQRSGEEGAPLVSTSVLATAGYRPPAPACDIRPPAPTGLERAAAQDRSTQAEEAPNRQSMSAREFDLLGRALVLKVESVELMFEPFDFSARLRCGSRYAVPAWLVTGAVGAAAGLGLSLWASWGRGDARGVDGDQIGFVTSMTLIMGLAGGLLAGAAGSLQRARRIAREVEAIRAEAKLIWG